MDGNISKTIVFCSQKLESFLGKVKGELTAGLEPHLGNWNGHSFHIDGKRCLIFLNSRTCYSVLITAILKKKIGDFRIFFRERLIQQLNDDFRLTEKSEVLVRQQLSNFHLCRTNNNRNVNGTMNQHVLALPYYTERFGPVEDWNELEMSRLLNDTPVSARVSANIDKSGYFWPNEAMGGLVDSLT